MGFMLLALGQQATSAELFTVGGGGTHDTIQAAIDAALAAPAGATHEVRIQSGSYLERLTVTGITAGTTILVSGGWSAGFQAQGDQPGLTVIDAQGGGRVIWADLESGTLHLELLTLTNGLVENGGAGLKVTIDNDARFLGDRLNVVRNQVLRAGAAGGGGVAISGQGTGSVTLRRSVLQENRAQSENATATGGGLEAYLENNSSLELTSTYIAGNVAETRDSQVQGGAIDISIANGGSARIVDNLIENNRVRGNTVCRANAVVFDALGRDSDAGAIGEFRRNRVLNNARVEDWCAQVSLLVDRNSRMIVSDSIVAGGSHDGVVATTRGDGSATLSFVNVTVARNGGRGLNLSGGAGPITVANSIVFGNGGPSTEQIRPLLDVQMSANLVDMDPLFQNPQIDDYRLQLASPAIDAGISAPAGGLGSTDVVGLARLQGAAPDIGAHESTGSIGIEPCVATDTTLCLAGGRFRVRVAWRSFDGSTGVGSDVGFGSNDSGLLWFFQPSNWEMLVKVLDSCSFSGHFWVFSAATTDVEYTLTVTDTQTGAVRVYSNPLGVSAPATTDTSAFPCS